MHDVFLAARSEEGSQKVSGVEGHRFVNDPANEVRSLPANASLYTHGLTGVNQPLNYLFVNILVAFTFGLLAITLVIRLISLGNNYLRLLFATGHGRERQFYWSSNKTFWWPWIKQHILYAPLFSKRHNTEIHLTKSVAFGTLPSRFHTIILITYLAMNTAYCLVLDYSQPRPAVMAELRGRTGALAVYNLIPTVLFALRNNPLIPLLQVSYDTFNLFHRWCARMIILESVAHTLSWAILQLEVNGWKGFEKSLSRSAFLQTGTVAMVAFLFMLIQAWAPIRHGFYETFLNIHRLMAFAAFVTVYMHIDEGKLPQIPWMNLVWAMWVLEWVFRSGRLAYQNISRKRGFTRVTIEALPSEACRVTFSLARPWTIKPGAHVHAYIPRYAFWSSHPFSVAWATDNARTSLSEKSKLPITAPISSTDLATAFNRTETVRTDLTLLCRARFGMTRSIYNAALSAPNKTITTWGAIEGPYGGHESLDSYGTVLLFAGGVGITHQLGFIRHLIMGAHDGTVATRKIILVWSVPDTGALEWIRPCMDAILKLPGRRDVLKILLYVTKPRSREEISSGTGSVTMFPGRCDPQGIVDREVLERVGAMVVTTCGPGPFSDAVRMAVRKRVKVGVVDFVEEAFTY